jgi:iron complex transport system permease protein
MRSPGNYITLLAFGMAAIVILLLQLVLGSVHIPLPIVLDTITGAKTDPVYNEIILNGRLPSAIASLLAGAALSISGLHMQILFRNPIAGPYVLGISAGANFGVACLLMLSGYVSANSFVYALFSNEWSISIAAALGAALVFSLIISTAFRIRNVVSLLIIGLMLGSAIGALVELMEAFATKDELRAYVLWTFASFRQVTMPQIYVMSAIFTIGMLLSFYLIKPLQAMLAGEQYAITMGINVTRTRQLVVVCTALLAGSITAFCGPVAFVGLAVPHICRMIFKTADTRLLTLACITLGALICATCSLIATLPGSERALPLNVVTSLLGAPYVVWLIYSRSKTM